MDLLPQELIDEIIVRVPPESLRSCSLVAKSWIYPSRRRLFETVNVVPEAKFWMWLKCISPTNVKLLQHVRSLSCLIDSSPCRRTGRIYFLRNFLPSLPRLGHLLLSSGRLESVTQIGAPLAFQHTLKHLSLYRCQVTISALVTIINYFPNLDRLDLNNLSHEVDRQPVPSLSRTPPKLFVTERNPRDEFGILDQFVGLQPQCDEVSIELDARLAPLLTQRVIDGVGASVKCLKLKTCSEYLENPSTLSSCRELRELEICLSSPLGEEGPKSDLVSSITSANIQKIVFSNIYCDIMEGPYWKQLDNSLCHLVDRLRCVQQLEVEFYFFGMGSGEVYVAEYLPAFSEKGRVGALDGRTKRAIYCSDGEKGS